MDWFGLGRIGLSWTWTELGLDQSLVWRWDGLERTRLHDVGSGPGLSLTWCSTGVDGTGLEWKESEWIGSWIGHWARDRIGFDCIGLDLDLGFGQTGALIRRERIGPHCLATRRFIFEGGG